MIARWMAVLAVAIYAFAQQMPPRDSPVRPTAAAGVVSGVVLTGSTGSEPARKARVMLNSVDGRIAGITATTDDQGRFEFRGVSAGRFTIEAYKPGYLRAFYGAARPNRSGTPVSVADAGVGGLTIRIVRGAAIAGTVRDARGRPVVGVGVSAYRYDRGFLGELRLAAQRGATTDDRGEYRLWGLQPGDYVVGASPTTASAPGASALAGSDFVMLTTADVDRLLQGVSGNADRPQQGSFETGNYAPVFHPSTADLALATRFALNAGDEREGVDLTISLVRTARIIGQVATPDGQPLPRATTVLLSSAGEAATLLGGSGGWRPRFANVGADGRFTFQDVSPGAYRVLVQSPARVAAPPDAPLIARYAIAEVTVSGVDVNVSLTMQPAMTITGRVVFDGTSAPPDNLNVLYVRLVPPGNGPLNSIPGGDIGADGTFTFTDVTPNDYRVTTVNRARLSGDWWLRSATANGREAWGVPLRVSPADKTELVLTYTDRPTLLSGQFQDASGRPAPDYFIVVFPVDKTRRTPGSQWIRDVRPGNDGHYSMRGMPAGEYLLAALTDLDPEDLSTPAFFDQLEERAVRITLAEGRTTTQDLRVGRSERSTRK